MLRETWGLRYAPTTWPYKWSISCTGLPDLRERLEWTHAGLHSNKRLNYRTGTVYA